VPPGDQYDGAPAQHLNRRIAMLDHVFLSVTDIERSIAFYTQALAPLGITDRVDYDGKDGPPGHPDLKGFGCNGRFILWLRLGAADSGAAHVGFIANSRAEVDSAYAAAMAAGATDNGKPSVRLYYDPRYYAGNVFDPDGYSLEFVFKSWQHPKPNPRKND
jgi:catechol 2,3-dioxygenase-like lactoylglutathione lyase family enzyme